MGHFITLRGQFLIVPHENQLSIKMESLCQMTDNTTLTLQKKKKRWKVLALKDKFC